MKVAVSIPDDVFESAEGLAKRLRQSRSAIYASALAEFVAKHRASKVTERLDAVYGTHDSRIDPAIRRAQTRSISRESW
jgi:metal-responsive CopG/Arc/MetJ family transcriptional regulator